MIVARVIFVYNLDVVYIHNLGKELVNEAERWFGCSAYFMPFGENYFMMEFRNVTEAQVTGYLLQFDRDRYGISLLEHAQRP